VHRNLQSTPPKLLFYTAQEKEAPSGISTVFMTMNSRAVPKLTEFRNSSSILSWSRGVYDPPLLICARSVSRFREALIYATEHKSVLL
jgi:hypothetical protein